MSAVPVRRRLVTSRGPRRSTACAIAMLLLVARGASAQLPLQPASPFDITGSIQAATLATPGDVLSGGTITVNNHVITVPRNTILQMPATSMTWQQLWAQAPAPWAGTIYTGLALNDLPVPYANHEAHVQGNRVGDTYTAGLIYISQHSLMVGEGFINYIDYVNGEMRVGGVIGNPATGSRVQINDPLGRFGPAKSPDVRFTIDEENPTVRSTTGYPMCLPRYDPHVQDDPACPAANRSAFLDAAGNFLTTFTMPAHTAGQLPDPYLMVPFEVGDFVDYNGIVLNDVKGDYISAWSFLDGIGAYTAPGTQPVYVAIDVLLQGVGKGTTALAAEAAFRTRVEGFTTDASFPVSILAMDVNPITGAEADRPWLDSTSAPVVVPIDQGPPKGVFLGRWRFRPGKVGFFLPATRELRASSAGGVFVLPNGLITGQYHAPIFDFIFPENLAIGGTPVPEDLETFPFLAQGSGPLNGTGPIVGQLSPWPGAANPPVAGAPAPVPPSVSAGTAQSVIAGSSVILDGSGSFDPNGGTLRFAWTQASGTGTFLSNATTPTPSFLAPNPAGGVAENLIFSLTVTGTGGLTATSTVTITVNPPPVAMLAPLANAGLTQTVNSGVLTTLNGLGSSDPNTPALTMVYSWAQTALGGLAPVVLTNPTSATPTFNAPINAGAAIVPIAFTLTVTNSAGKVSTASVTVNVNSVQPPFANAGATFSALVNSTVALDGSQSVDPNGLPLTYSWVQQGGGLVVLTGANTAKPTFKAPSNATTLGFVLTVNNGFFSSSAVIQIFIVQKDQVVITSVVYRIGQTRLKIQANSNVFGAVLTASFLNTVTGQIQTASMPLLLGVPTADIGGVPIPPNVTVTSSFGGSQTSGVTRIQ